MKAKKKILSWVLLIVMLGGLVSCDPDDYYDGEEETYLLCRQVWVSYFTTWEGIECEQTIYFNQNGSGVEAFTYFYPGRTVREETNFFWWWDSDYYDVLYMQYPDYYIYFDAVRISETRLQGYLDKEWVEFTPY